MAFVVIAETPGLTQEQYDKSHRHVFEAQLRPARLLVRLSGPMEGGWRIIDVWASEVDANTFGQSEPVQQMIRTMGEGDTKFTTWHVNDVTM
jgi:hypothetical protein